MNKICSFFFVSILTLVHFQCATDKPDTMDRLLQTIDQIDVINTHEHQRMPYQWGDHDYGFYHLATVSYLSADIRSAGAPGMDLDLADSLSLDELWNRYGEGLNKSRGTSYYGHFIKGFQKLYGLEDLYFTQENIAKLDQQVRTNYENYETWLDNAVKKAGIELMFNDQYWDPFNCDINEKYFALVFHINPLVSHASEKPEKDSDKWGIYKEAEEAGYTIENFDDYLSFCEYLFEKNVRNKAVCVKNSMAYGRSLDYEDVPYETAAQLFSRPSSSLTSEEAKKIQDFMFHWIIKQSIKHDLPIQIHTGYLAGNGNTLDNGKPVKLNNLFLKYPDAKFVLFHGGYPWTGEYAAFGKMFPNVFLDIVWLPQISRQAAVSALDEIYDTVPYNKLFWGGDCAFIEETVGSLQFGKEVVAEVLAKRIERGLLTAEVAEEMARGIFRENAIEFFNLEEKLDRKFTLGRREL